MGVSELGLDLVPLDRTLTDRCPAFSPYSCCHLLITETGADSVSVYRAAIRPDNRPLPGSWQGELVKCVELLFSQIGL